MTSVGGKRKRRWGIANGGRDAGAMPRLPSASSCCTASILVAAISSSQKSAALRRHLSKRGAMSSLLLLGGDGPNTANDHSSVVQVSAALQRVSGQCVAQLLSVLYDEVQSNRNVEPVLRFVHWVLSVRFDLPRGDALETTRAQESLCRPISKDEGWIPCVAFMLAFNALTCRVEKVRMQNKKDANGKSNDFMADGIISSSIFLVERVRCMNIDEEGVSTTSMVERCFSSQMSIFRRMVAELKSEDASLVPANHDTTSDRQKSSLELKPRLAMECEKDWWEGVDLESDLPSSEEECGIDTAEGETLGEKAIVADASNDDDGSIDKQLREKPTDPKVPQKCSPPKVRVFFGSAGKTTARESASGGEWETIERAALDLRAELIEVPPGATSADIQSYTDRIFSLIRRAGTERGADGVAAIGSTLHGNAASVARSAGTESTSSSPLTDILIQQLCKTCIDGSTSAIRAAAFIRSFVLPLVRSVGTDVGETGRKKKASAPSRILTATITSLAKERPIETVEALFVPVLIGSGETNDTGEFFAPNQTQADLVSKAIKTGQLSEEALSVFVVGLVDEVASPPPMSWNDSTMPILTTLMSKRPNISDDTAKQLAKLIENHAKQYCKNSKFSTLFHTFVTKHGPSIQEAGCVNELTASAEELKTFMGKSIKAALKKLSNKK